MNEHPILFSGAMVKAILEGRKTQTRRIVKPQPTHEIVRGRQERLGERCKWYDADCINPGIEIRCPFGALGDRLWVRETWAQKACNSAQEPLAYKADAQCGAWMGDGEGGRLWCHHGFVLSDSTRTEYQRAADSHKTLRTFGLGAFGDRWRPSIHMPRWACRLTLDLLAVRVERVQDISEDDARAEGCADRNEFACRWIDCYGAASWDQSQWTWVLTFQRASEARP